MKKIESLNKKLALVLMMALSGNAEASSSYAAMQKHPQNQSVITNPPAQSVITNPPAQLVITSQGTLSRIPSSDQLRGSEEESKAGVSKGLFERPRGKSTPRRVNFGEVINMKSLKDENAKLKSDLDLFKQQLAENTKLLQDSLVSISDMNNLVAEMEAKGSADETQIQALVQEKKEYALQLDQELLWKESLADLIIAQQWGEDGLQGQLKSLVSDRLRDGEMDEDNIEPTLASNPIFSMDLDSVFVQGQPSQEIDASLQQSMDVAKQLKAAMEINKKKSALTQESANQSQEADKQSVANPNDAEIANLEDLIQQIGKLKNTAQYKGYLGSLGKAGIDVSGLTAQDIKENEQIIRERLSSKIEEKRKQNKEPEPGL